MEKKIFLTFGVKQGDPKGQIQAKLESYLNLFQIITVKPNEVQTSPNFQDRSGLVYWPFQKCWWAILKPFLTENEKMEATFQVGIDKMKLF